jgi:alcohol dehydrogenase class IV
MSYDSSLNFIFRSPAKIVFGENTTLGIAIVVESLKCKRALIVTDKDLRDLRQRSFDGG